MRKHWSQSLWAVVLCLALLFGCSARPTWQEQYDLGVRYLTESNYQEAILAFTAAIEIDPKQADAYVYLAQACLAAGDPDAAEEARARGYEATGDSRLSQSAAGGWVSYNQDVPFDQQLPYRDFSLLSGDQQDTLQQLVTVMASGGLASIRELLWQSSLPPQLMTQMEGYKISLTILTKEEYSAYCAAYSRQMEAEGNFEAAQEAASAQANRVICAEIRAENGPAYFYAWLETPAVSQAEGTTELGNALEVYEQGSCQDWQYQGAWSRQGVLWSGAGYQDQLYTWEETGSAADNQVTSRTYALTVDAGSVSQTVVVEDGVLVGLLNNGVSAPWDLSAAEDADWPQPYTMTRARW